MVGRHLCLGSLCTLPLTGQSCRPLQSINMWLTLNMADRTNQLSCMAIFRHTQALCLLQSMSNLGIMQPVVHPATVHTKQSMLQIANLQRDAPFAYLHKLRDGSVLVKERHVTASTDWQLK